MSSFSVLDFLNSGKKSLSDKNYYSALAVALMLPSICSRIEYQGNAKYCKTKNNGKLHWNDNLAYTDFCNEHLRNGWLSVCFGRNVGETLYNLRCDIVHAGCANIYDGDCAVWLSYGQGSGGGLTEFAGYKIVSIESICEAIFNAIEIWVSHFGISSFNYTLVFGDTHDDQLLYGRLCDSARADVLEKKFLQMLYEAKKDEV